MWKNSNTFAAHRTGAGAELLCSGDGVVMAAETMETVAYRMVAPVGLDFSKIVDTAKWNKMLANLAADDAVMAATSSKLTPYPARSAETGKFTLLSANQQRIMSRLL